ncbi:hypothetical protein [Sulfidibacter corallicola]|uniref:Uncharacterized protein n=1 Tax=Sulfidibacter corallicola TaxID=2818388 RepID=A0A8A4TQ49_SULCO|nr:hypothetical protein [Sulfidibacter corallicola]QTD52106.1 hypothetical protein J3U87_06495 [Sulfidibacter corallicola]
MNFHAHTKRNSGKSILGIAAALGASGAASDKYKWLKVREFRSQFAKQWKRLQNIAEYLGVNPLALLEGSESSSKQNQTPRGSYIYLEPEDMKLIAGLLKNKNTPINT